GTGGPGNSCSRALITGRINCFPESLSGNRPGASREQVQLAPSRSESSNRLPGDSRRPGCPVEAVSAAGALTTWISRCMVPYMATRKTTVYLDAGDYAALQKLAKERNTSAAMLVREAIA